MCSSASSTSGLTHVTPLRLGRMRHILGASLSHPLPLRVPERREGLRGQASGLLSDIGFYGFVAKGYQSGQGFLGGYLAISTGRCDLLGRLPDSRSGRASYRVR
jgi:hypothetical protein